MKIFVLFYTLLLCLFSLTVNAQTITVTGQVIDKYDRTPVWNAHISVKNDSVPAISTDENGYYSINIKPNDVLVFYMLGYNIQEVLVGGRTAINVEMDCEDCGGYSTAGMRQPAHILSALAAYTPDSWGYALEYAYQPPINRSANFFNKMLWYANPNVRVQKQSSSDGYYTLFPHLRILIPKLHIPLFVKHQRLSFFVDAGYYFDTNFKRVNHHNLGFGGGFTTKVAYLSLSGYRFFDIHLIGGYAAYVGAEKKNSFYLGLRFYLGKVFMFE